MPMSVQLKKVYDQIEAIDKYVRYYGFEKIPAGPNSLVRFSYAVFVQHEDGSILLFEDAYALLYDEEILVVVSEHNGEHVFHTDDLVNWWMCKRTTISRINDETFQTEMKPHTERFQPQDKVKTQINPNFATVDWSPETLSPPFERRHDVMATVVKVSDAHGLSYKVKYEDGVTGWFNPWELRLVEKA